MPSVREIAELAGVSLSTVSLVLNNKPGVSEVMRSRVHEALEQLDSTHPFLNNHGSNSESKNLSIVILHPQILRSSEVFGDFLQGIEAAANTNNIHLRFLTNQESSTQNHISNLYFSNPDLQPDGVIVIGYRLDIPLPKEIFTSNIPCVLVGREDSDKKLSTIGPDEYQITYNATQYLIGLGHREIAFIGGKTIFSYTQKRINGYKQAILDADLAFNDQWVALGEGAQAAQTILETVPTITAALIINDTYAEDAIPVLQQAGKNIPQDLSIISFDDTAYAKEFTPSLTSISYPRYFEGYQAIKTLLELIQNPIVQKFNITVSANLVKRNSCRSITIKEKE